MSLATISASSAASVLAEARLFSRPFEGFGVRRFAAAVVDPVRAFQSRIADRIPTQAKNFWSHAATSHVLRFAPAYALYDAGYNLGHGLIHGALPLVEHAFVHGARAGISLGLAIYAVRRLVAPRSEVAALILKGDHAAAQKLMRDFGGDLPFPADQSLFSRIAMGRIGWSLAIVCPVLPALGFLQDRLDILGVQVPSNLATARMAQMARTKESPARQAVRLAAAAATAISTHWLTTTALFTYLLF